MPVKRKLIVASHGTFAQGALDAAVLISGRADYEVSVFCMQPGQTPADFIPELEAEIIDTPDKEFVILADLFGASICNAVYPLTRFSNVKLFTDFNLRLLLEVMADYKDPLTPVDMETIVTGNREYLRALHFEESFESEDF
jgi:mannose/fructose-specific phosphotransferase system component IIA